MEKETDKSDRAAILGPLLIYLVGSLVAGIWYASKVDSRLSVLENKIINPTMLTAMQKDFEALKRDHDFLADQVNEKIIRVVNKALDVCEDCN